MLKRYLGLPSRPPLNRLLSPVFDQGNQEKQEKVGELRGVLLNRKGWQVSLSD